MDYSSGSGVAATQTAVLYLPRGRCRCLRRCLCLVVKAAEAVGAETLAGSFARPIRRRSRRACGTCAGARLRKEGLSNKSRKSKITPVRINSGRGEIVKIGLVRQPPRFRTVFRYSSAAGRNTIMPLGRFDKSGNAMSVAGRTPGAVLRVPDTLADLCPVIWLRAAASIGSLRSP